MTTFVTGGTSSIGRVLLKELAGRGEDFRVLVRPSSDLTGIQDLPGITLVKGDVTDPQAVRAGMAGCERVCHLAAVVGYQLPKAEWWRINRDGTGHVLQTALELGVQRMVQVSSMSVLGSTTPGQMADESHLPDSSTYTDLYAKTKRAADDLAREYAGRGLAVSIVYPGFGYGCSWASSHTSFQEQTLLRLAANKPVVIFGSGTNTLCLSYYRDTVAGIFAAFEKARAGEGYMLGGNNLNFIEIWAAIGAVLGKQPPRRRVSASLLRAVSSLSQLLTGKAIFPGDFLSMITNNWCYSSAKAERELGWQPHPFREAMAETWAEYQQQGWRASA
ncbi:MAG TPA: NAD-dependent epimerase/dehydratase family protein [Phototrophicaceae bacterium]|nr:NAD-dependent epimerase/dehydratase family protein [Phototrophicaceae bacterium]